MTCIEAWFFSYLETFTFFFPFRFLGDQTLEISFLFSFFDGWCFNCAILVVCLTQDKNADLAVKIEEGFGPSGLGILSVTDVCDDFDFNLFSWIPIIEPIFGRFAYRSSLYSQRICVTACSECFRTFWLENWFFTVLNKFQRHLNFMALSELIPYSIFGFEMISFDVLLSDENELYRRHIKSAWT